MNDLLSSAWRIECSACGKDFNLDVKEFEFEEVCREERPMGVERTYESENIDFCCTYCGREIKKITLYEYPDGVRNYGVAE